MRGMFFEGVEGRVLRKRKDSRKKILTAVRHGGRI
jgi:hypothetical protein